MNDGLKDKYRQAIIDVLCQCEKVQRIVLFGSRAMGTFTTTSDIDIVLYGEELSLTEQADLTDQLKDLTVPQSVDVLLHHTIKSKELLRHIEDYGVQWWPPEQAPLIFGECATEVRDRVLPENCNGTRYIGLEHIEQNTLHLNAFGSVNDVSSTKSKFSKGDILFGKLRPYFRKIIRAPFDGVCSTDIWVVRAINGINQGFLYYWMASQEFVGFSMQGSEGTRMPRAKWNHVSKHQIPFFTNDEQKAIAHILGSLDDKIELNRQMNETLEAMAQALFKSWFVDFDPVIDNALAAGNEIPEELKAKAKIRKALGNKRKPLPEKIQKLFPAEFEHTEEMGWIPKGWRISTVGEEVETAGGGTPSTKDPSFWHGGIHAFCTPKDMASLQTRVLLNTERLLTDKGVAKVSSGQLPSGTVLMSSRAPIGYLAIADIPVTVNQGIIAMMPQEKFSKVFLFCWADCNMNKITEKANGSTFLEISKKNFRTIPFLIPDENICRIFNGQTDTICSRLISYTREIKEFSICRDTLLPKLLAGKIRVPDAGKLVEGL